MEPTTLIVLGILAVGGYLVLAPKASATPTLPGQPSGPALPSPVGGIPTSASTGPGTQAALVTSIVGAGAAVGAPILAGTLTGAGAAAGAAGAAGAGAGSSGGAAAGVGAGAGLSAATAAITAGIGIAVTIFAVLWSAHKKREAQAKNENQAVNIGIAGFDQDIRLINSDYQQGKIDANTAIAAVQQALAQFAILCAPHIQPDRNGCNMQANGSVGCASWDTITSLSSTGKNYCDGNIGAACCVYCTSLKRSANKIIAALQSGVAQQVQVNQVFASKYGTMARAAYSLVWARVAV